MILLPPHWLLLLLVMLYGSPSAAQESATRGSEPPWVERVGLPPPSAHSGRDSEWLLEDQQVRVEQGSHATYRHIAYALHTSVGVHNRSELRIPRASDAQLTWHFVRVHRAGRVLELLPDLKVRIIQPESRLDAKLYDESREEVAFLYDVRIGDVVEYAYTVRESDSVLGGAFVGRYSLSRDEPVLREHLTVAWPAGRSIRARVVGGAVNVSETSVRYHAENVPGTSSEAREPAWLEASPSLELSEFPDWASVVDWALPHYAQPATPDPLVIAQANVLRAAGDELAQATAAVRFVQDEIRYLGVEVAEQAVVPQAAGVVLSLRYGDCKGKTNLLVALLRQLGIDAAPALVSWRRQRGIAEQLPSPLAFDHVITRIDLRGRELYVDAAKSLERRPLITMTDAPYGRALVLRPGEHALRELHVKMSLEPQVLVREMFSLTTANVAALDVETTYTGARADGMRLRIASEGQVDAQKGYLNFYGASFGAIEVRAPLTVADDPLHNRLVLREHYTLNDVHGQSNLEVGAWSVREYLPLLAASRSPRPFALEHPVYVRHEVVIDAIHPQRNSHAWFDGRKVDSAFFAYEYSATMPRSGVLQLVWTFASKGDHVMPDELSKYTADVNLARDSAGYAVELRPAPTKPVNEEDSRWLGYILVGALASLATISFVRRKLRAHQTGEASAELVLGETAATAIRVKGAAQLARALRRIECCNARLFEGEAHDEPTSVRYGDESLLVYRRHCPRCSRLTTRYVAAG